MSIRWAGIGSFGSCRPTSSPMKSMGASSRSPSPMTIRPANSISSIVRRIASTADRSASSFSPRPMNRAEASAAASVTRTISSARSCSTTTTPGGQARQPVRAQGGTEHVSERTLTVRERARGGPNAAPGPDHGATQCRKCLFPVKTIAM